MLINCGIEAQEGCPDTYAMTWSSDPCNSKLSGCSGGCSYFVANVAIYCGYDFSGACDRCDSVPVKPLGSTIFVSRAMYNGTCQSNIKNNAFCSCGNPQYVGELSLLAVQSYNVTDDCGCWPTNIVKLTSPMKPVNFMAMRHLKVQE